MPKNQSRGALSNKKPFRKFKKKKKIEKKDPAEIAKNTETLLSVFA